MGNSSEELQRRAAEGDPGRSGQEKASELTPALERYAEETERKEGEELDSGASAPSSASPGVAEHEREMQRRGFNGRDPEAG